MESKVYVSSLVSSFLEDQSVIQTSGCLLVKSVQAIIVAEYAAPTQHAEAAAVVEGLADYLITAGF